MKITRFKTKYRIDCTEGEFFALRFLVQQGMLEGENAGDDPESGWNTRPAIRNCPKFSSVGDAMSVDVDLRERES